MTHAQWLQLSNQAWLAHYQVQAVMERNRKAIDPCDKLKRALACASRSHRKRSHLQHRLVITRLDQLRSELTAHHRENEHA